MPDKTYSFDLPPQQKSIIKVIGVGGGGSNAVNHMFNQGIRDVEFFVCNTDVQALQSSPVPNKIQIGTNLTKGLGAGANPEKGKNAAIESKEEIRDVLSEDTRMLFITAGMGGGTGTGAAPEIAKVAKELGILTVGIVTQPFGFEGRKKIKLAEQGLADLRENCDTVLVILNDKLREVYSNLTLSNAFAQADNVLTTAAKSIAEIITLPGYINVDFEDVKTVMANSGAAVMGSARAEGDQRSRRAAEMALSSPLLDNVNIRGAQKILLSIKSGDKKEIQMDELDEITSFIHDECGQDAEMIFGHGMDEELQESVMVTVIATGFKGAHEGGSTREREEERDAAQQNAAQVKRVVDLESNRRITPDPVKRDSIQCDPVKRDPVKRDPVRRDPVQPDAEERPVDPYRRGTPPPYMPPRTDEHRPEEPYRPESRPEYRPERHPERPHHDHPWNSHNQSDDVRPDEAEAPPELRPDRSWDMSPSAHTPRQDESQHDEGHSGSVPPSGVPPNGLPPSEMPPSGVPPSDSREDRSSDGPFSHSEGDEEQLPSRQVPDYERTPSSRSASPDEEEQYLFQREMSHKKRTLMEEAYERKLKLRGRKSISSPGSSQEQFQKENFSEPAYMRKNVHLYSTPPSNDKNVSRYSLDDESNIVGNNRFLHDNVD